MSETNDFGVRLRTARDAAKMFQHELADRAGLHRQTILQLEAGKKQPSWITVQILCQVLSLSTEYFVDPAIKPPPVVVKRPRGRPRLTDNPAEPAPAQKPRKRKGEK
jgi:DNA-binding XRE family transcriptional regulator